MIQNENHQPLSQRAIRIRQPIVILLSLMVFDGIYSESTEQSIIMTDIDIYMDVVVYQ